MYNYVVTAHKPSKVTHTQVGSFLGRASKNLLVGKVTYIEVYNISKDGFSRVLELPIHECIAVMKLFRMRNEDQDRLLIFTKKHKMKVIRYNVGKNRFETLTAVDVLEHMVWRNDGPRIGVVDPQARCIGIHDSQQLFKVFSIDYGTEVYVFDVRLVEEHVVDLVFLHGYSQPTIALLCKSGETSLLRTYELCLQAQGLTPGSWQGTYLDGTCSTLVAIPEPVGGVLVIGYHSVVYLTSQGACANQPMEPTITTAVDTIGIAGSRYIMGDHKGQLMLLSLVLEAKGKNVSRIEMETLGETSIPSSISYLDNGFAFIASACSDSQIIKLQISSDRHTGSKIEVANIFQHLGPITDFCIMRGSNYTPEGQGQVVTCSGVGKNGSLRIVRYGVGISEQATAELPRIKAMFSLRRHVGDKYHSYIMQSFTSETRTLELVGTFEMTPASLPVLDEHSPTLHAENVIGDLIVQVTATGVRLLDCATMTGSEEPAWRPHPPSRISGAAGNTCQLVLSTTDGILMYLEVDAVKKRVQEVGSMHFENEISCVDCSPLVHEAEGHGMGLPEERAHVAAVGLWAEVNKSTVVKILALPSLQTLHTVKLGGDVMARSVLFATLEGTNYFLVGLGDGFIFTYTFNLESAIALENATSDEERKKVSPIVSERQKLNIGTQPVNLTFCRSRGSNFVFAACDRPTVVYATPGFGKLLLSNVNLQEVSRVCGFHTEQFPYRLVIALEHSFQLGAVDEIQKLHITPVPLGEHPRRIAHVESARAFVVLTQTAHIDEKGEDVLEYFVRLIHDSTYDTLHKYKLRKYEMASAVTVTSFEGEGVDSSIDYIVVGTTFELPGEKDPSGRILAFNVEDGRLNLVAETKEDVGGALELAKEDLHHGHILAYRIQARGQYILVGDLTQSVLFLRWKQRKRLQEVSRNLEHTWPSLVEMFDDDVFTVGAMVNKIVHGPMVTNMPEAESPVVKTLTFATGDGMLGFMLKLKPEAYKFFHDLQKAMESVMPGLGGLKHDGWREMLTEDPYRTAAGKNYLDGDLIERFGDLALEKRKEISSIVKVQVEDLTRRVEEMQRLSGAR